MRSAGTLGPVVPETVPLEVSFREGMLFQGNRGWWLLWSWRSDWGSWKLAASPRLPGDLVNRSSGGSREGRNCQDCEMSHLCPSHCGPISVGRAPCTPGGDIVYEQGWDRTMALSLLCFMTLGGSPNLPVQGG